MYFVGKRLKKKHNIEDERRDIFLAADEWVEAVGVRKFMGESETSSFWNMRRSWFVTSLLTCVMAAPLVGTASVHARRRCLSTVPQHFGCG
jgi:hypothetical protein